MSLLFLSSLIRDQFLIVWIENRLAFGITQRNLKKKKKKDQLARAMKSYVNTSE